jgi:hypothetical protein
MHCLETAYLFFILNTIFTIPLSFKNDQKLKLNKYENVDHLSQQCAPTTFETQYSHRHFFQPISSASLSG